MKKADLILSDAVILQMDVDFNILEHGAVVIKGDTIVAVGKSEDLHKKYDAVEALDCAGKVVIPGLINAHTHAPMTLLRGLTDDQRLDVWLLGYMMPVEREFVSPEFCYLGTQIACAEMLRSGVTCFADMYYFEDAIASAVAQVGMRAVCGQTVLKFPSPDAESYEDAILSARTFIRDWKGHPRLERSSIDYPCHRAALCLYEHRGDPERMLFDRDRERCAVADSYR
jgi:5-methylthioadenosine/S-adenosylhomocysteine deaminase